MAWPIFALCLSAQVELSAQRTPPSPHEEDAPAVVLEDVEVSARRGSARISAEREFDGAAIDNLAAYDIAEVVRRVSERRSRAPGDPHQWPKSRRSNDIHGLSAGRDGPA